MSSIKQVLPTIKNKFVGATGGRPRAFNERPYITKGQRFFVSVLFHTPCLARYSVLHLLGVLSGEGGPPLCKGRWIAQRDGRIVKAKFIRKTIPQPPTASAPFTQGRLWFACLESPSAFPDKHCFCGHKSEAPPKRGKRVIAIFQIVLSFLALDALFLQR